MARSRRRSDEFEALRMSSTRFRSGYSRPMTGVVSSCLKWSREPDSFRGSGYDFLSVVLPIEASLCCTSSETALGAILREGVYARSGA